MPYELEIVSSLDGRVVDSLHLIGRRSALRDPSVVGRLPDGVAQHWSAMTAGDGGDFGRNQSTLVGDPAVRVVASVLPERCSRHNNPARVWAWGPLLAGGRGRTPAIIAVLQDESHAPAAISAIARTFPQYNGRSARVEGKAYVLLLGPNGVIHRPELTIIADAVRKAAWMVDLPPNRFGPDAMVNTARSIGRLDGVTIHVLRRSALLEQGLRGLAAVGQAAAEEPALVVLDWAPSGATRSMGWVGKGITYDTGGLSLKTKTGMPGMKTDMGGGAAVLAAFEAAVRLDTNVRLTAVVCVAENAIGPHALRPDDVLQMFSGRTVEINNTDAEGRLVLADGVAWCAQRRSPDVLVDLATLTGAQGVATGKLHGALYCNDEALERRAVAIGRARGDLVHPLPYAPELFRKEFMSSIADMKNSVKDRANAQSSCAAQFIANHMGDYRKPWLHVDMASPARTNGNRGTGYGVNLLLGLLDA